MKNLKMVVVTICIAALTACDGGSNRYVIKGVVPDKILSGETVYMSDYTKDIIVDSAEVTNGKFVFEGVIDEAEVIKLVVSDLYADFVLEKGTISVDLSDPYSAKGTPLNDKLSEFWSESDAIVHEAREQYANIGTSVSEVERSELQKKIVNRLFSDMETLHMAYLKEHPNDAMGAIVFYIWMQNQMDLSAEKFQEVTGHLGEYVLNFGPVKKMAAFYETLGGTAVGKPFIDFTIENGNRDGSPVSLSDYVGKGKYVLVDFWASWCKPCRMETPVIAEVYNKYKGDKFDVVSVAVWDERKNTVAAIEEDGNTWPQILDAQTIPTELYGIRGIPQIILFGPDGTILARDLRGDNLKAKVAEVMM
ncbi:MAG: AhpC/TSA family protein [Tannerella sp.]|jgi:thiol-disulfide isomerase/thioredoxin|nr:AhpC/TSA family protein [Tannerella sp.]